MDLDNDRAIILGGHLDRQGQQARIDALARYEAEYDLTEERRRAALLSLIDAARDRSDQTIRERSAAGAWTAFSDAMPEPHRLLLVTNNLQARTAQGHMSHVWLVGMVHAHERAVEFLGRSVADAGEFTAFAHPCDMPLRSLSHWRYALPEER